MQMLKQSDWLRGRIALSRRAARFELPMDVGDLAEMSPVEYLRRHCIISQRRRALYKKAFVKVDKDNDGKINRKVRFFLIFCFVSEGTYIFFRKPCPEVFSVTTLYGHLQCNFITFSLNDNCNTRRYIQIIMLSSSEIALKLYK